MKTAASAFGILFALAAQTASAAPPDRIVLPSGVTPTHYDIAIVPNAAAMTFSGAVKIDIDVAQPTTDIKLNAADLAFSNVSLSGVRGKPKIAYDSTQETATLTFPKMVGAGHHVLGIAYTGKINQHASGLFGLDYDTAQGKKRALFTQFENSDARRFIPSWDEPAQKAVFTLTATVPANEMAVSNTPIEKSEHLPGGLMRVHFAPSPKMSSYLLFFGLGDFERVSRKVNGVDIGVIVKRGDTDKAQFALDAAAHILPYYEQYFDVKYPLPKLDLIAGPGESQFFGAMENWGAIFYFERDLLIDPKISTQSDQRDVYIVVAHEMAHQWFGDLVTMAWWDDLWLNEGFASWMEFKATDHFHPEWKMWLEAMGAKEGAMRVDSRAGTHPIITPIRDVLQANEAFDTITYSKGEAVIRMLENYVGEDQFRAGVRNYIKAHAYGNTVTDDLWRELDKTSATPVTPVAHDFTLQAGVPLIRVTPNDKGLHLTQDRFAVDETGNASASWHVPVVEAALGKPDMWRGLVSKESPADVPADTRDTTIVNAGQAGYFRTLYEPAAFQKLAAQFHALAAADQLGLLNDSRALGYSGYEPLSDFLALASAVTPDVDTYVQDNVAQRLDGLDSLYQDLPGQAAFEAFGRHVVNPLFAKVGWTPAPDESQNVTLLRGTLLSVLSDFNDPAIIAEARKRFAAYVADNSSLSGDLRRNVLEIVAYHADSATWEQLHTLAKNAKTMLEKREFYVLLGGAHDRALAERALQLALTDEAPLTVRPSILDAVSDRYPELAVDLVAAHADVFNKILEPDSRSQFVPRLASPSHDLAIIPTLQAYAAAHIPADAQGDVVKAEGAIRFAAKTRTERLPDVDKWLATHPSK